jgi:uncharacterized protein (DUF4415 family)
MSTDHEAEIAQRERLLKLAVLPDDGIDTSDIPEAPAASWTNAEIGRFYRPRKEAVTIRLDADVLEWFRRASPGGRGYQTSINAALREYIAKAR